MGAVLGGPFWRTQAYLLVRWLVGVPIAVALIALLAGSVVLIFAPVWALTGRRCPHRRLARAHAPAVAGVHPRRLAAAAREHLVGALLARPFRSLASSLLAPGSPAADDRERWCPREAWSHE